MSNAVVERVSSYIKEGLDALGAGGIDPAALIEIPPKPELGDYAFPCFQLAKALRRAPQQIAAELAGELGRADWLRRVEVVGAYVNLFLDPASVGGHVVRTILREGDRYGASDVGHGKRVVIDFSSPNIAKPFHVGHLRSTAIGHSLARIFEHLGYDVVRLNYLGDWGTQFGKLIVAYRRWGSEASLEDEPIKSLLALYVRFHEEAEKDPSLEDEARAAFRALEEGAPEEMALWERFRYLSLKEFDRHYKRLGVTFDSYRGESAYNQKVHEIAATLDEMGLLTESEGARVVELEGMAPCLITKSDGATLYAARDLAAACDRFEEYGFSHLFYVVGAPQQLHFKQVFGVLRRMGFDWVDRLEHIPFGQVRLGDAQLSTRKGNVIFLEELLDQAVERVRAIIEERNPGLERKDEVAEMVGIGAIIFNDLSHNRIKDIVFDWDSALNFDGDTGPYVQYTHARAASVLRRLGDETPEPDWVRPGDLGEPEAFALAKRLADFPSVVRRAADEREPSEIARYLLLVCHDFNSFYHVHRIFGSEAERARLALTAAVKQVLAKGLYLLGVQAPESM